MVGELCPLADRLHFLFAVDKTFIGGAKTEAGKGRIVPVSSKIQPIVDKYTKDKIGGSVFTAPDGSTLSLKNYRNAFYITMEELGFENPVLSNGQRLLTPHSCRHTFATLMKAVPAPDKDKLKLIGHASDEMLRYYQDVNIEDLRAIINML